MDIVSSVTAVVGLVFNFATAIKTCNDVRGRYKDAEKTMGSIKQELETLQGALQGLANLMMHDASALTSQWDTNKTLPTTFERAVRGFRATVNGLQGDLEALRGDGRLGKMDKVRFLWNEDGMKEHLGQLRAQSSALQLLLIVLQTGSMSDVKNHLNNVEAALVQLSDSSNKGSSGANETLPAYRNGFAEPSHIMDHEEDLLDLDWPADTPEQPTGHTLVLPDLSKASSHVAGWDNTATSDCGLPTIRASISTEPPTAPATHFKNPPGQISVVEVESPKLSETAGYPGISPPRQWDLREGLRNSISDTAQRYNPRTSSPALIRAVRRGDIEDVKSLLAAGNDIEARHPTNGQTAAINAAFLGDSEILGILLESGASVTATDKVRCTALHYAASEGWKECASLLLSHGAPINCTDFSINDPLHFAVQYGHEDVVKLLLPLYSDPLKHTDVYGENVLHKAACFHKTIGIVKLLLDQIRLKKHLQNCSVAVDDALDCDCPATYPGVGAEDYLGDTPLQIALYSNIAAIVSLLLQCSPSRVNSPCRMYKWTSKRLLNGAPWERPLHYATRQSHLDTLKVLLAAGADISLVDKDGKTPLELALQKKQREATTVLLAHGVRYTWVWAKYDKASLLKRAVEVFSPTILDDLVASCSDIDISSPAARAMLKQAQAWGKRDTIRVLQGKRTK